MTRTFWSARVPLAPLRRAVRVADVVCRYTSPAECSLRASDGVLTIRAANDHVLYEATVECEVTKKTPRKWSVVSVTSLRSLLAAISNTHVNLDCDAKQCTITATEVFDTASTRHTGKMPVSHVSRRDIARNEPSTYSSFTLAQWRDLLDGVAYAISGNNDRPHLEAGLLEIYLDGLSLTGTNGHRLAHMRLMCAHEWVARAGQRHKIPLTGLVALDAMDSYAMRVGFRDDSMFARADDGPHGARVTHLWVVRLADSPYPGWRHVVPSDSSTIVRVPLEQVRHALKGIALVECEGSTMVLEVESDHITLTHQERKDHPVQLASVIAAQVEGPPVRIALSRKYVEDILECRGVCGTGDVTIELADAPSPILVHTGEREHHFHVLMPMRL